MASRSNKRLITEHLIKMAEDQSLVDCKAQSPVEELAQIMWKMACGWASNALPDGTVVKRDKPAKWAIDILCERLEGRVKPTEPKRSKRGEIQDRIRDLTKNKINELTEDAVDAEDSVSEYPEDMDGPDNGVESSEDA